ncbi:hypothetical protein mRhiFer1_008825 [Rhinolophus ferrumequinum]|uniref:Uncharacterized protein n=1 Tax=Rhinolophus ferrumequinum TaxID=59479 RepID=A0A7J8AEV9_RHIFE|nr:hypothetical protein mRhiFer1_008825 [Rhinolophus ferrumequinum]
MKGLLGPKMLFLRGRGTGNVSTVQALFDWEKIIKVTGQVTSKQESRQVRELLRVWPILLRFIPRLLPLFPETHLRSQSSKLLPVFNTVLNALFLHYHSCLKVVHREEVLQGLGANVRGRKGRNSVTCTGVSQ